MSASAAGANTTTTGANGNGGGRGGHGGRGVRHGRGGRGGHGGRGIVISSSFKGNTEEMNGHVFQCFNETSDKKQFAKTVEALGEYVAKKMKFPGDLSPLIKQFKEPTISRPPDISDDNAKSALKKAIWDKKVASYCTRLDYLDTNLKAAYAVIWGQCSDAMKANLVLLPA